MFENDASSLADLLLDSTLQSVDRAEELVTGAARQMGFDEEDLHKVGIAVRESMVNAVAHGNRYNTRKKVHLQVWKQKDRLVVDIADDGNGFEVVTVPDPLDNSNLLKQSGRGLLMIRAFMDEFVVSRREPSGTRVRMVKILPQAAE
ncbi:MAG: ATP-binding protein [Acidimicrobiia bacterium]|nr:ATP-binding protein [Acidimicrobiia bacterium]